MAKFDSVDAVREERDKLNEKYEDGLPSYLKDYFDDEERKQLNSEYYKNKYREKYSHTAEERKEYVEDKKKEFWENNKLEIVKRKSEVINFEDPPIASERLEQEELSQEEIAVLISLCEDDLYLFAVRYFPHYLRKPSSKLHKYLYKTLSREFSYKNLHKKTRRGFKKAIAAPRGNAKCEDGDTDILLDNGTTVKLRDIQIGQKIQSVNENLKIVPAKIIAKEHSGLKNCLQVRTKTGKEIKITPEHRIFTFDGWKQAKNLTLDDRIASPRRTIKNESNRELLDEEVKLIAYLLAEGCLVNGSCTFTNTDDVIINDFKKCCNKLGFKYRQYPNAITYGLSKGAREWCKELGIYNCDSHTKRIPTEIFSISSRQKRLFIAALIDTDGWVTYKHNGNIGITLANKKLIEDIYYLLLQLDINSNITYRPNDKYGAWSLVFDKECLEYAVKEIPCLLKKSKMLKILNTSRYSLIDTYPNKIKKYYTNVEREFRKNKIARVDNRYDITRFKLRRMIAYKPVPEWIKFEEADVFWDKIISIDDCGICDTYDIEVEDTCNFIGNGLVSHNSSLISCILPVWCICYEKKRFMVVISDTAKQSEDFLSDIKRELLTNELIMRDFPHLCSKGPVWRQDEIITTTGIRVIALGTGSKVRGRKYGIDRPDLFILDDLENSEMVRSKKEREYIRYDWFNRDLLFAGDERSDFFIVGTVIGKDSLLNAILDPNEYPGWDIRRFSAVITHSTSPLWDEWRKIFKNRLNANATDDAKKFFEENKTEMLDGVEVLWPEGDPYYDLMVYYVSNPSGFFCFKENTPVILDNYDIKNIQDIKTGDKILSSDGSSEEVIYKNKRDTTSKIIKLKIVGWPDELEVTEEHPFYIWPKITYKSTSLSHQHFDKKIHKKYNTNTIYDRINNNKFIWKNAIDLNIGDCVVQPIPSFKENCIYCNNDLWWLVGYYLAEGSINYSNNVISFTANRNEKHYLENTKRICRELGYGDVITISDRGNSISVLTLTSKDLLDFLKLFGRYSHGKYLPEFTKGICYNCFRNLLDGYLSGDGYLISRGKTQYHAVNSTSRLLLENFRNLLLNFGYISYLYKSRKAGKGSIDNKEFNARQLWSLQIVGENITNKRRLLQSWIYNGYLYSRIQRISVEDGDSNTVYGLSVSGNKTYCIPGAIVHNSEKQNSPYDPSKVYITEDELTFKRFTSPEVKEAIQRGIAKRFVFGAIDPSLGKKSSSGDYSAIVTLVRDPRTGAIFVIEIDLKRRSVDDQISDILDKHDKYHYKLFGVETNAFQYVVAENLRKLSKKKGLYVPVYEINQYSDKVLRIEGIIPFLRDGTIIFDKAKYENNQMYNLGVEQLLTFTGEEDAHDDFPDCLEMAFNLAKKPKFKMIKKSTNKREYDYEIKRNRVKE